MTRTTRHLLPPHHERGSILGLAAVGLATLLLAVGLCVDVGHWYLVTGELQNAADAAAIAATSALDYSAGGITQAVDRAIATVNKYEFNGKTATITRDDVRFAARLADFDAGTGLSEAAAQGEAATIRYVKVTVPPKSVGVFFVGMVTGSDMINLSRNAVAGFSQELNRFGNIVPLALVENLPTETSPHYLPTACGTTELQFRYGCQYTLTVNNGSSLPIGGEYLILDLASSRGGSSDDLRTLLSIGSDGDVVSGQTISLRTGNKSGQISGGLDTRFDSYAAGIDPVTFPPDANIFQGITYAQYKDPSYFTAPTHPGVWNRRLVVLPIITPDQYDAVTNSIRPTKFGAFFMTSAVGSGQPDLHLEYLGVPTVIGNGGYDPTGGPGTPNVTAAVLYR